jgi:unsaturated rhamnogalacturonyl hydrolase
MVCGCASQTRWQPDVFRDWPTGASPEEVGRRVAENFVVRPLDFETNPGRQYVIYPEVCTWYGSLTLAKLINDQPLTRGLIKKFEPLLTSEAARVSPNAHVDYRVFGAVPLEIYIQTKDKRCLTLGQGLADKQWEDPGPTGLTREARFWIDDMYMIPAVQVQAFRATGDPKYLDHASLAMVAYLDKLQQPNGLFYHGVDSPFLWGRGNGWVAAGMTELLSELPAGHPRRARVMEGYTKMMSSLLKYQDPNGMWHQLIDKPEAWPETSSTGMFAFAMVTGVKKGWLDSKTYGPAARKAWLALIQYLDKDANIGNVCAGTNKGNSIEYYLARRRNRGDLHGQAPILWTASALLR